MPAREILGRGARQLRVEAEKRGLYRAGSVPRPSWPPPGPAMSVPVPGLKDATAYLKAADEICAGRFDFFGRRFELGGIPRWNEDPLTGKQAPDTFGKSLDYRDDRLVGDIKHLWELNRHLELVTLAQAYALSNDSRYLDKLRTLISSWIGQCPFGRGPHWCSSLELAIRLINWHLAYLISGGADSPLFRGEEGEKFLREWLETIYRHTGFVMGHLSSFPSSANNHFIGELAGVFVAACTWPCWPQMERWRDQAGKLLCREAERQIYPDGVNKEQAIWYQQAVFFLLVVSGVAGKRAGIDFPEKYWEAIARMAHFVSSVMDISGNVPMIGDADDGLIFALEPKEQLAPFRAMLAAAARLFDNETWRKQSEGHDMTARWLCDGIDIGRPGIALGENARAFPDGGYYVLGDHLGEANELRMVVDAGRLGYLSIAGHGHADCLSATLSIAGREHLVDPGTYSYHSDRAWRDYFRGTAAHNTVRIDGLDQSEIGGPFLWLRKAEPTVETFESTAAADYIKARHSGYLRLRDPVVHIREIHFDKQALIVDVVDRFRCQSAHVIERFWHFAEDCVVELEDGLATCTSPTATLRLEFEAREAVGALFRGSDSPISGWISRRFNDKVPTFSLVVRSEIDGDHTLQTRIRLGARSSRTPDAGS